MCNNTKERTKDLSHRSLGMYRNRYTYVYWSIISRQKKPTKKWRPTKTIVL